MMAARGRCPQPDRDTSLNDFDTMRNCSELFRAKWSTLISETDKACKRIRKDAKQQLGERLKDVQFLKRELELKLEEIIKEVDDLTVLQSKVVKAQDACKEPLRVTILCLEERMKTFRYEKLHDEVDKELLKEKEVIQEVETLLLHLAEQITEQIRLNRCSKYLLEQDLKEKFEAQCIDNSCVLMTTHCNANQHQSKGTKPVLPSASSLSSQLTPKQWEDISDMNIAKAEQQKNNSMSLRMLVESLLEKTAADMQKKVQNTTAALHLNIQEMKSTKSQLGDQLVKFQSEITSQQRIRDDLIVKIKETEQVLSLVQSQLALRHRRPSKEKCCDPAQFQLLSEVQQLNANINKLREAVTQSDEEYRALLRCELELQENIAIKINSLYIDEVICVQHREPIVINKF